MANGRRKQTTQGGDKHPDSFFTDDYFVYPHAAWMILVPFGLYLLFVAAFSPDSASSLVPWPLDNLVSYMGKSHKQLTNYLSVFAVVLHSIEAAFAGKIAMDKRMTPMTTAKWSFMTFMLGIFCFRHLLSYKGRNATTKTE